MSQSKKIRVLKFDGKVFTLNFWGLQKRSALPPLALLDPLKITSKRHQLLCNEEVAEGVNKLKVLRDHYFQTFLLFGTT